MKKKYGQDLGIRKKKWLWESESRERSSHGEGGEGDDCYGFLLLFFFSDLVHLSFCLKPLL